MAHISHEAAPSSSPSSTSSPPLAAIESREECFDSPRYRQKEVADGNVVRLFESQRRRRRKDEQPSAFEADHPNKSLQKNRRFVDASRPLGAKRTSVIVHAPKSSATSAPLAQRPQWVDARATEDHIKHSQHTEEEGFDKLVGRLVRFSELPTPPSTPRMERLPTPEMEPLNERPFCNCCGRCSMQKAHRVDESVNLGDRGPRWRT
jgi:hypothetical protein